MDAMDHWIQKYNNFRKRKEYTRRNIIILNYGTWNVLIPKEVITKVRGYGCFIDSYFQSQGAARCYTYTKQPKEEEMKNFSIELRILEQALYDYLIDFTNIKIYKNIKNIKFLQNNKLSIPQISGSIVYDFLVGADGSNSIVRKKFFAPLTYHCGNIYTVLFEFKFPNGHEGHSKHVYRDPLKQSSWESKNINSNNIYHIINNRVRVLRQQPGILFIILQLSKSEYLKLNIPRTIGVPPKELQKKIMASGISNTILLTLENAGYKSSDLQYIKNINPINVRVKYSKLVMEKNVALIGDSAFSTFFITASGLNFGLNMAFNLLASIRLNNSLKNVKYHYNTVFNEIKKANINNVENAVINFKFIEKMCDKKTKEELIKMIIPNMGNLGWKRSFINNYNKLSKKELCYIMHNIAGMEHVNKFPVRLFLSVKEFGDVGVNISNYNNKKIW